MTRTTRILLTILLTLLGVWWWTYDADEVRAGEPGWQRLPRETGSLVGHLAVDEDIPADALSVEFEYWVPAADLHLRWPLEVQEDGGFEMHDLPAGVARLRVRAGATVLAERADLAVVVDGVTQADFDVRGLVHAFEFRIVDAGGEPVAEAAVGWRPSAPEEEAPPYAQWILARRGEATIYEGTPIVDLLVLPRGAGVEELLGVSFGRTVILPEAWAARVALPAEVDPEVDGTTFEISVRREGNDERIARPTSTGGVYFDTLDAVPVDGGEAWLELPDPGPWRLGWRAFLGDERLDLGRGDELVTLVHGDGSEVVTPAFPLAAYRAALARANERR